MKMYHGMMCLLLLSAQLMVARLAVLDVEPTSVELLSTHEMRFCWISFVRIDGTKYIIKQKKSAFLRKIVSVVRDAITAHIAETFGIGMAHQVDIIPAGKSFPGKPRKDWPATIHTIAPGKMIKAQKSPYKKMHIQQKWTGFTRSMIKWMKKHPAIVKIMALDTFVCNHDRHRGNFFYDPKKDSFCAIDMDSALRDNIAAMNAKNFTEMFADPEVRFKSKDVAVLIEYRNYLKYLIKKHKPEDTLAMYDYFTEKAGFVPGADLYTEKVVFELESNRAMIVQSYKDVQKLVAILGQLIKKARKSLK